MPVPPPFIEIEPPWIANAGTGKSMSSGGELSDPRWPVFLRAVLIGRQHEWRAVGPDMSSKLRRFPGWFLYGGPVERRHAKSLEQYLAQWAFSAARPELGEPGFFTVAEVRPVAPPMGTASQWPSDARVRWAWSLETRRPYRYRLLFAGMQGAHWQKAGGGEVAGDVGELVPDSEIGAAPFAVLPGWELIKEQLLQKYGAPSGPHRAPGRPELWFFFFDGAPKDLWGPAPSWAPGAETLSALALAAWKTSGHPGDTAAPPFVVGPAHQLLPPVVIGAPPPPSSTPAAKSDDSALFALAGAFVVGKLARVL